MKRCSPLLLHSKNPQSASWQETTDARVCTKDSALQRMELESDLLIMKNGHIWEMGGWAWSPPSRGLGHLYRSSRRLVGRLHSSQQGHYSPNKPRFSLSLKSQRASQTPLEVNVHAFSSEASRRREWGRKEGEKDGGR